MDFPSLLGVRPRSEAWMLRSIALRVETSNGRISKARASGTLMDASWMSGVGMP